MANKQIISDKQRELRSGGGINSDEGGKDKFRTPPHQTTEQSSSMRGSRSGIDIRNVVEAITRHEISKHRSSSNNKDDSDGRAHGESNGNVNVDTFANEVTSPGSTRSSTSGGSSSSMSLDRDFEAAFSPAEMRCLALVSHNGMKKAMKEFVIANKNLLKKFRLTGTNSTITMLKEVFKDEPRGSVFFGPSCSSGPLGGDAELVAHMVTGKIGAIFFFQDPMDTHPHRSDIECLCRQAMVHNTVIATTPTTAMTLLECFRMALQGKGERALIPSFFSSLQSPTVNAYKAQQKSVVNAQK